MLEDELLVDETTAGGSVSAEAIWQRLEAVDQLGIRAATVTFIVPILWTVISHTLRALMVAGQEDVDGLSDYGLINVARTMGYLYSEEQHDLKGFLVHRNNVLHGLPFEATEADCRAMRDMALSFWSRWEEANALGKVA